MVSLARISRKFAWCGVALICVISFAFMLHASQGDSAIMDELAHIPAGYGYVHNLDYRLNPEHPPLVKALAMMPVLFLDPTFPTNADAWRTQVNAQWDMGYQFLYNAGNDADQIVHAARFFPMLLTILLILLVYLFARRLMGSWWALFPAFLVGLDPTVLAHGHYVTTDIGAAFGILLGIFTFTRFVENPSTKNLWLAGLAFGVAMLMKFSTPLLVPLYAFLLLMLVIRDTAVLKLGFWRSFSSRLWHLIAIGLIGYLIIVYPAYFLFTLHYPSAKQATDSAYILASFANGPTPAGDACHGLRCLADLDIKMAGNPLLRPFAEYMLGILMVLQRADGGNTIYFLGHVVNAGGRIYFPLLYILKEPIPTLVIVVIAFLLALAWTIRRLLANASSKKNAQGFFDYVGVSFSEFAMGSFVLLYWLYSIQSPLNIGLRHVLPTLPLIAILSAGIWKKWIWSFSSGREGRLDFDTMASFAANAARTLAKAVMKYAWLLVLLVWLLVETFLASPYFLSYFNELGGGTADGYHWVTDSNYDWGQDLLRLKDFVGQYDRCVDPATTSSDPFSCPPAMEKNLGAGKIGKIAVDYFGGGNPKYEFGAKETDWSSSKGNPADQGIHWLAVSVNTLESAIQPVTQGMPHDPKDTYSWLTALRPPEPGMGNVPPPDFRAGTSIFIYHL